MTNEQIRYYLNIVAESEYKKFLINLIPNINSNLIIGVRIPKLRQLAKQIVKNDWRSYLKAAYDDTFEEIMLQGIVIGYIKTDIDEYILYIKNFIPKINNWSVCDSFCSGLKLSKVYQNEIWNFIQPYLKDKREYYIRFGVVMLIYYYTDKEYIGKVFQLLNLIKSEFYYSKMAVAWAISIYYIKFPQLTLKYLENNSLDDFTYNKALQKIIESSKVDEQTKQKIRLMKRKN